MATPQENCVTLLLATSLPQKMWCRGGMEQGGREKWNESTLNLEELKTVLITETNQNLELLQNCFHHSIAVEVTV